MTPIDPRVDPSLVPPGSKAVVIAEKQDEYIDLPSVCTPAHENSPPYVITRWELTNEERAALIRGEDLYITLLSNGPINPLFVTVGPVDWTR